MRLGFVSAIFPEWSLHEVFQFAAEAGFSCVELMCWPPGAAERRYAGVTHLDVNDIGPDDVKDVHDLCGRYGVSVSGLGYYPNPLSADPSEAGVAVGHLHQAIDASAALG